MATRSRLVLAVAVAVLALPASAARADWGAPQRVGLGVGGTATIGPDGSASVGLTTWGGGFPALPSVLAARAPATGAFGSPTAVIASTPAERAYGGSDIGFAADGSGVLLTRRVTRPHPRVRAVLFDAGGRAAPARTISSPGHTARILFDQLAVAANGRALATWLQYEGRGAGWHVEGAWRAPGADRFGAPIVISGRLGSRDVNMTTDANGAGDALVTWRSNGRAGTTTAVIARNGVFSTPRELGPTGFAADAEITDSGSIVLAEQVLPGAGFSAREELRVFQAKAGETSLQQTGPVLDRGCDCSETVENLGLAVSPAGRVALVAGHVDGPAIAGRFELRLYTGSVGSPLALTGTLGSGPRAHNGAGIATDDAGSVLVGWSQAVPDRAGDPTARSRYALARARAGRAFEAPVLLGPESDGGGGQSLALGLLPGGGALAVWDAYTSSNDEGHSIWAVRLAP